MAEADKLNIDSIISRLLEGNIIIPRFVLLPPSEIFSVLLLGYARKYPSLRLFELIK